MGTFVQETETDRDRDREKQKERQRKTETERQRQRDTERGCIKTPMKMMTIHTRPLESGKKIIYTYCINIIKTYFSHIFWLTQHFFISFAILKLNNSEATGAFVINNTYNHNTNNTYIFL